ncbi:MAG: lactate utilization protein [Lentihominibacter sp.]|nr:lactate utilization protein [Lentihominibacter sp.]
MNANIKASNKAKIETLIKKFESRNITGYYAENSAEAVKLALELTPEGSHVSFGGSVTITETGIRDALKAGNYNVVDPWDYKDPAEGRQVRREALLSDVFFMSANAVTIDGEIVNVDGTGNRVAGLIFGPEKVIIVIGANKIVSDEAEARARIKSMASPPNNVRLKNDTPCALTGKCVNCLNSKTICNHTVITRRSGIADRIHVIMVNENLGY